MGPLPRGLAREKDRTMKETPHLTPDELRSIELQARILRAEALASAVAALGRWILAHLPLGHRRAAQP